LVGLGVVMAVAATVGLTLGHTVRGLGEAEPLADGVEVPVGVPDGLGDALADGLREPDGVDDALGRHGVGVPWTRTWVLPAVVVD
jgi:hypothetical protein